VGGRAALPMWMDYMRDALKDTAETSRPRPPGLVDVRIDRNTGMLAAGGDPDAIMEVVQDDHVPASGNQSGYGDEVPLEELY
jgi:penicillin-binding protein 1A